jgi:hypothetical protein
MIWTVLALFFHVPAAVPQFDEPIFSGDCGVAKNPWVIDRIDAVQAARDHKPTPVLGILRTRQGRGCNAEDESHREGNLGLAQHFTLSALSID